MEALGLLGVGLGGVLLGRGVSKKPHRLHRAAPRPPDEVDQALPGGAAKQVEHGHLHRRMRAAIAGKRAVQRRSQALPVPCILPVQQRRQMIADRGHQPAQRVSGHGRGRCRLAPSDRAVGGLDADQQIVGGGDGFRRHLHGRLQGQRDRDGVDAPDRERPKFLGQARARIRWPGGTSGLLEHGGLLAITAQGTNSKIACVAEPQESAEHELAGRNLRRPALMPQCSAKKPSGFGTSRNSRAHLVRAFL